MSFSHFDLPENKEKRPCPYSSDEQHGGKVVILRVILEGGEELTDCLICPVCIYEDGGGLRNGL